MSYVKPIYTLNFKLFKGEQMDRLIWASGNILVALAFVGTYWLLGLFFKSTFGFEIRKNIVSRIIFWSVFIIIVALREYFQTHLV